MNPHSQTGCFVDHDIGSFDTGRRRVVSGHATIGIQTR